MNKTPDSEGDTDIDVISSAIEKKARFLASEIETARLNGFMTENQKDAFETSLTVAIASLNQNFDDCYVRGEIDRAELKKRLATSWSAIESYLKEVEELKRKKRAKQSKRKPSSRVAGKRKESALAAEVGDSNEETARAGVSVEIPVSDPVEAERSPVDSADFSDEALLTRGVDVSGLSDDVYNMSTGKKRRIEEDMVRTATEAAKEKPFFIGRKREATDVVRPVDDTVAGPVRPEKVAESGSLYGEAELEQAIAEAETLNEFYFAVRNFSGEVPQDDNENNRFSALRLADFLGRTEHRLLELSDDEFEAAKSWRDIPSKYGIGGKFRELVSAERDSYSKTEMYRGRGDQKPDDVPTREKGDAEKSEALTEGAGNPSNAMEIPRPIDAPDRKKLEVELKRILSQLSEKSEQLAKVEQERLDAEEYWKEAVDIREREEKNPGGMLGMFLSDDYKEKTLRNLREEETEDERRYRKIAAHADELKKEVDVLRSRRDELERDLEELPDASTDSAAEENPSLEQKTISQGVLSKFESMGMEAAQLREIEGFSTLSEGQQLLVFENLQQLAVGRIREEAEGQTEKDRQASGWAGRLWKSVSKQYQIAKAEKAVAADVMTGGMTMHGETLRQLVTGMRLQGPEVRIGKDGKTLEIQFASGFEGLSDKDRETVDAFNVTANDFARMPYEWSLGTATKDQQERYATVKEQHDALREKLLGVIRKQSESIPAGMLAMSGIDDRVQMMQFLQNNPDLEKRLDDLKDQDAWKVMLSSVVTERGLYMASGYAGRTLLAGTLGWAAAPVVATVMGGIVARKRAEQELRDREVAARRGREDKSDEKKNFVPVKGLSAKLEKLLDKVMESSGEKGQIKAALSLKARIEYTRMKLEEGLVDFGSEAKDRVWEQYDLFHILSQAEAVAGVYSGENEKLKNRLAILLESTDTKIKAAEKKYIRNQTIKGVAYAAGFSVAGVGVRHLSELIADRIAVPAGEPEPLEDVLGEEKLPQIPTPPEDPLIPMENSDDLNTPFSETEKAPISGDDGVDPWGDESEAAPKSPSASAETQAEQLVHQDTFAEPLPLKPGVGAETVHGTVRSAVEEMDEYNGKMAEEELAALKTAQVTTGEAGSGASSEIAEKWNEAAESASLGESPRPQVALSNEAVPDYSETGAPAAPETVKDEAAMEELVEKLSKPEVPQVPDVSAEAGGVPEMKTAPVVLPEEAPVSAAGSATQGVEDPTAPLDAVSSGPPEATGVGSAESAPATIEIPKMVLGDTKAFVGEHPDMLEPLKREVGSYRFGIFRTTETEGDINHDYIHSGLGKTGMADALESHEYGKPSDLHVSQLGNLSEFREAAEKAFVAKLGEQEGKGVAVIAAGETIDEYTRRMATIALQLGVKIKGF